MASKRELGWSVRAGLMALVALTTACGGGIRRFPLKDPLWNDPDRHTFSPKPEEYYSPFAWDGANQIIFRPISRFFAVDPAGESVNVNAWDEVPDSSWFRNRIGRYGLTPEQSARGPCTSPLPSTEEKWTVTGAKPNGANPGFLIKAGSKRYLVKFDGVVQGPRATAADVLGSRIYHAAGYFVPCNRIIHFDRSILEYAPDAEAENEKGDKEKLSDKHLDRVFEKALRLKDGRYRANLSLFLEGKPIGPWTYQGTRDDDPNDVIAHEDRRELRGMEVLAAWTNHFDSREQNTLATYIEAGNGGYVRHNVIDFGDCFGSIWEPPMLGRRIGHAYYLDIPYVMEDFVTLGLIDRPWEHARFGSSGKVFGYYDVESFVPDMYRPGYPNPAFVRKSERDSAWMARIIARMDEPRVRAMVMTAQMTPALSEELMRILMGRRAKILERYLTVLSPLAWPRVKGGQLCLEDLAVLSNTVTPEQRNYSGRAWLGDGLTPETLNAPTVQRGHWVCTSLPAVPGSSESSPEYLIVDLLARSPDHATGPARVHLYHLGGSNYRVVGLERPDDADPPG